MPALTLSASEGAAWAPLATAVLSLIGLLLCAWLAVRGAGAGGLPGCGAGSGCEAVTRSRWAKWLGMPVAVPAAAVYGLVLAGSIVVAASPGGPAGRAARLVPLAAAPLLAAAAAWFVGLQALLLRRLCPRCLLLHALGVAVAAAVASDFAGDARWAYAGMSSAEVALVLSAAGAGVVALVLGQVLVKPRTYLVKNVEGLPRGSAGVETEPGSAEPGVRADESCAEAAPQREPIAAPSAGPDAPNSIPPPNPYLGRRVAAGRVPLAAGAWPVLGRPDAAEVAVFLFCYTCGNCRHLQRLLRERMEAGPERLAVMLVPVPTEPLCNPTVRDCGPEHADACAYARLALGVWGADWSKFEAFNRYLFEGHRPRPLEAARARAEALLGRAVDDPRRPAEPADRLIRTGVSLYQSTGSGLTPTLLLARGYAAGHVPTAEKLEEILKSQGAAARREAPRAPSVLVTPGQGRA